MLSLVAVVLAIKLGVVIRTCKGKTNKRDIGNVVILTFGLFFILLLEGGFFCNLQMNDEAYFQSKIDTLTQENQIIEEWNEVIKEKLSDEPELLQYASTYFESKLEENNEELNRSLRVRDDIQPILKWLLYFG